MRLINVDDYSISEFIGHNIPLYAILSHTWGDGEVSLQDMENLDAARQKEGFKKIEFCCNQAKEDSLEWAWVDTCCIDKTSSAELSEAINSMYQWYSRSMVCYAYLSDAPISDDHQIEELDLDTFRKSRWFTRGWTLQELLAPLTVQNLDRLVMDRKIIWNWRGPKFGYHVIEEFEAGEVAILLLEQKFRSSSGPFIIVACNLKAPQFDIRWHESTHAPILEDVALEYYKSQGRDHVRDGTGPLLEKAFRVDDKEMVLTLSMEENTNMLIIGSGRRICTVSIAFRQPRNKSIAAKQGINHFSSQESCEAKLEAILKILKERKPDGSLLEILIRQEGNKSVAGRKKTDGGF